MLQHLSELDRWLSAIDNGLRTVSGATRAARALPQPPASVGDDANPSAQQTSDDRLAGALMRVNHVGEVCAQALYQAQALATKDPQLRQQFEAAAREEADHLGWTQQRLQELGDRPSLLNPLWYAGAFGLGLLAGRLGDRVSLGFLVETERQVEAHLASHLDRLPPDDLRSRAIVEQMKADEVEHAQQAQRSGATELPSPVPTLMRAAAKVMTTVAHRI